jgi:RNA recognition motif-containing protein
MNTIREIEKINLQELDRGIAGTSASWHRQYEQAAWVYVGNLGNELTEGDVLSVMSQYGEVSISKMLLHHASFGGIFSIALFFILLTDRRYSSRSRGRWKKSRVCIYQVR